MRIFRVGEPEPMQKAPPVCVAKLSSRLGVFDPLSGQVFGLGFSESIHTAELWTYLETVPWEHDILVMSDDPTLKTTIMSNLGRLNVYDFMYDGPFKEGTPYLIYPPMAMALQAISMLQAMKLVSVAPEDKKGTVEDAMAAARRSLGVQRGK